MRIEQVERPARYGQPRAQVRAGRDWYRINNAVSGVAEIDIYDEIGYWGVTAQDFLNDLRGVTASAITVRLNSPGGEIFDGVAIANALASHPATVTAQVDSLAASIASVIAVAGADRVVMMPHSQLMIHDGSGLAFGNAQEVRELAELLDRQSNNIAAVYAAKAGGTVEDWRALMLAETWYTAEEAVAAGLADEVMDLGRSARPADDAAPMAATWDLSVFRYAGRAAAPAPANTAARVDQGLTSNVEAAVGAEAAAALREHVAVPEAAVESEPPATGGIVTDLPPFGEGGSTCRLPEPEPADWVALTAHLTTPTTGWADLTAHLTTQPSSAATAA